MNDRIYAVPLSQRARGMMIVLIAQIAALWAVSLYAYVTLPEEIATHFTFGGKPDAYGGKETFLILPAVFSIAPALFLALASRRFWLVNRFPNAINIPSFHENLTKLPPNRRGEWVNRFFEIILALGAATAFFLLALLFGIYYGTLAGGLHWWFTVSVIVVPLLFLTPFFFSMQNLAQSMQAEVNSLSK